MLWIGATPRISGGSGPVMRLAGSERNKALLNIVHERVPLPELLQTLRLELMRPTGGRRPKSSLGDTRETKTFPEP